MHRKDFFSSLVAAGAALPALASAYTEDDKATPLVPPYLKEGDYIGITSPAGYITLKEIQPAILQMEKWGFRVRIGDTIGKRDFSFGGTDAERAADFQRMLDDHEIKAVMCARGGYGAVRIIDQLNFHAFSSHPKWIIGFSDITVVHAHLNRKYNIASLHSKMCNSFPDDWSKAEPVQIDTILSIGRALKGDKMVYTAFPNTNNIAGISEGVLVGGNLKTIESLSGSASDMKTKGKILFVEDTGEYLYSIDRMFWNLKRTGKLEGLKGLVIGGFKVKPDDPGEEFGRNLYDIVLEKVNGYKYPVCFDFPVGHQKNNYPLKCGVMHRLEVQDREVNLREI